MLKSLVKIASGRSTNRPPAALPQAGSNTGYFYFQIWLVLMSVLVFAFYVGYDLKFFHSMLQLDQSYLSILILLVFAFATLHAAWHILAVSQRIELASAILRGHEDLQAGAGQTESKQKAISSLGDSPRHFVEKFTRDLSARNAPDLNQAKETGKEDENAGITRSHILEIYADQLRSPVEVGWYIVDILVRLGLIGTIIGFILILRSLIEGPLPDASEIQKLLIKMSGGMGTALYTTLSGLVTAMLLGIQYLVLGRSVERLIADLIRISDRIES